MRNIRFFFEEDMNVNNEYNIWTILYSKYVEYIKYLKR
jgi:hypothetical protein